MIGVAVCMPRPGDLLYRAFYIDICQWAIGEQVGVVGRTVPFMRSKTTRGCVVGEGSLNTIAAKLVLAVVYGGTVITLPEVAPGGVIPTRADAYIVALFIKEIRQLGFAASSQIILNFIGTAARHEEER